jgi:hypothetical protein
VCSSHALHEHMHTTASPCYCPCYCKPFALSCIFLACHCAEYFCVDLVSVAGKPFMLVLPFVALCGEKAAALQARQALSALWGQTGARGSQGSLGARQRGCPVGVLGAGEAEGHRGFQGLCSRG